MMQEPAHGRQISVLVVDDSAFMRTAISQMINSDPELLAVATATNGTDALQKIASVNPDVVTLDVEMPGMDGLQTLRCIMARFPRPVVMVSSATVVNAETTFEALQAGAFDYIPKQMSTDSLEISHIRNDLIAKIKTAAHSHPSRANSASPRKPPQSATSSEHNVLPITPLAVTIGTSTGGPKALQEMLPLLPADLSVPILIVQHMPPGFTAPFAKRLNSLSSVKVCEAAHQQTVLPGVVYIAPSGIHMTVQRREGQKPVIRLVPQPENHLHIPSADVLMESAVAAFGGLVMGVIMTGMGSDGALGMQAIHSQGGFTVGQDEATSAVYGMPRVCAEQGILNRIVPLAQIPYQIMQATRYRRSA
jgi:two-component system, chemotaxis family, protein-glutamate methylesterase/glutaminase